MHAPRGQKIFQRPFFRTKKRVEEKIGEGEKREKGKNSLKGREVINSRHLFNHMFHIIAHLSYRQKAFGMDFFLQGEKAARVRFMDVRSFEINREHNHSAITPLGTWFTYLLGKRVLGY
jgi:hypothetical protein